MSRPMGPLGSVVSHREQWCGAAKIFPQVTTTQNARTCGGQPYRTIAGTGRAIGRSPKLAYAWSAKWHWRDRAAAWDEQRDRGRGTLPSR